MGRSNFLDKDLIFDKERENIFHVITNYDTRNFGFVFAMLKYKRDGKGLWRGYNRVLKNYGVHNLVKNPQNFMYQPCLDASFPVVYTSQIGLHLTPEDGLDKVMKGKVDEDLTNVVLSIVDKIGTKGVGVGGSILAGTYHSKSDVDLIIYGKDRSLDVYYQLNELGTDNEWIEETSRNYELPVDQVLYLYDRKRRGILNGVKVSINFVDISSYKLCNELCESFYPVNDVSLYVEEGQVEALFYPARVKVSGNIEEGKIDEIISYEGIYSSLLFKGGKMRVDGVLIKCENRNMVIIGDRKFRGNIRRFV
ncbi:nucleotidyltransferase domain-containing protein [Sulfuracidifex metallicus]|uniref:Nucleotidyltransferase n=1 Tax=Sulfuracidifex metallicus DSM 6482 = JCM 9184 TaxID=523847 RepID=A0A6A9QN26_SULME|nr:nucleotidyltransferase domain-containing protein [Sulfuracidifex metallicus]MUN28675.1 nucleotidyltransferase [Sulfuracidifex metallicus DSM 6482 = JCM 9184]WOE50800.1 nucleotidyltransferase domain-containing protein [Sulfuracidifex metallicus DSM 6482 = JCM 9184]